MPVPTSSWFEHIITRRARICFAFCLFLIVLASARLHSRGTSSQEEENSDCVVAEVLSFDEVQAVRKKSYVVVTKSYRVYYCGFHAASMPPPPTPPKAVATPGMPGMPGMPMPGGAPSRGTLAFGGGGSAGSLGLYPNRRRTKRASSPYSVPARSNKPRRLSTKKCSACVSG